jgi:hypothetical protein
MTPEERKEEEAASKRIEFFAAGVNAWITSSLELDKNLLTLSAAGIGLLASLLTTVGVKSAEGIVLYVTAIVAFGVTIAAVLVIFRLNKLHLEKVLSGEQIGRDPLLSTLDAVAALSFAIGVLLTAVIGIAAAVHSYEEHSMSKKTQASMAHDSVNGIQTLQQAADMNKSLSGIGKLNPQAPAGQQPSGPAGQSPSQQQSPQQPQSKPADAVK